MRKTKTIRVSEGFADFMASWRRELQRSRGEKITMIKLSDVMLDNINWEKIDKLFKK
jgi:hypothetical protein